MCRMDESITLSYGIIFHSKIGSQELGGLYYNRLVLVLTL